MFKSGNVTVYVGDFERAVEFYTKTLNLPLKYRAGNVWAEVGTDGLTIGICPAAEGEPKGLSIGLMVEKIDAAVAQLRERGVSFQGKVMDCEYVKLAIFQDPEGNPHYLCELKPAAMTGCCECSCAKPAAKKTAKKAKKTKARR
ncbi:MAG: VOC family protein [Planctomycetes bacterium]|nr:VOC family protein [Planctomycetota bacterium]